MPGSVHGSCVVRSMNRGKYECPAQQGFLVDLSIVSKLTSKSVVGLSFGPLTSNLNPKKGFLPDEKSKLANPL